MKLLVLSDLHTEFAPFDPPRTEADAVVLAGDTAVGTKGVALARGWFPNLPIVMVAGNHEYYAHAMPTLDHKLAKAAEGTHVHVLQNRAVEIGGVRFLGCTLWTDFELFGERRLSMDAAEAGMSDFRRIRVLPEYRRFRAFDAAALHRRSAEWLRASLAEPFAGPTVVVTHHAPSLRSAAPPRRSDPLTAAYASDLEWMLDGCATLWVHGHTHWCVDYALGGTRVLSNQRGYPDEPVAGFDPGLVVEV